MDSRTTVQVSEDLRRKLKVLAAARDSSYQQVLEDMVEVFRELDKEKTVISIPKKLAERMQEKIKATDFTSLSEYTTFILRLMLYEEAETGTPDEDKIRSRLERLGYI